MSPTTETTAPADAGYLGQLTPLAGLHPSPLNPRKRFDTAADGELVDNIKKNGVLVPLLVRRKGGRGEIVDGERRFRAARAAGLVTVPVVFRDGLSDSEAIELMLLNQMQRQDLTPLEEAAAFKALIDSNPAKYSRAYLADRISRSEKWVWDRMKLLDLIPVLRQLLEAERILVGHAEVLSKLKAEDQLRASAWDKDYVGRSRSGLWQVEAGRLHLDDDDEDIEPSARNLFRGLKPVTVKELESWVAHHVRFDVEHMATSAPLDFGPIAERVEAAQAKPGRGKKVIAITHAYRVDDDAKTDERTFGAQSWRRADGQAKSKTCDHSVLGVVVAGPEQGTTLQVCIARDRCEVHFGAEVKARAKNEKLRQQGKAGQAAKREAAAETKRKREAEEREAKRKAWEKVKAAAVKAIADHVRQLPIAAVVKAVAAARRRKATTAEALVRAEAVDQATGSDWSQDYLATAAKPFGFDLKTWVAAQAKASTPPPAKKGGQ